MTVTPPHLCEFLGSCEGVDEAQLGPQVGVRLLHDGLVAVDVGDLEDGEEYLDATHGGGSEACGVGWGGVWKGEG